MAATKKRLTKNYPGHIRKSGDRYRVFLCIAGKVQTFGLGKVSLKEAREFARMKHAELTAAAEEARKRRLFGLPDLLPMSALLEAFERLRLPPLSANTQRTYKVGLARMKAFFVDLKGDPQVTDVRPAMVREFLDWRRSQRSRSTGRPPSNRGIAKLRTELHAVFEFATAMEMRETNPVRNVAAPKADPRTPVIITDAELHTLLESCVDPMLGLYVLVLAEAGLRSDSEALWLRWEDVDLDRGYLKVESSDAKGRRTKSGKTRWVPMTARLHNAMREHVERFGVGHSRSRWVFHHLVSRRRATIGQRIGCFRNGFRAAVRRAGLPKELHQHDLRHRRVTSWLAQGKPAHLVKEAMGHSDLRTTMGYSHLVPEHLRALVEG